MPNPKLGTVTMDVAKAVGDLKVVKSSIELKKPASSTFLWGGLASMPIS